MTVQFDLERYLNVRSAYGASFSADGTLSFLMDTTGTSQVWTLDESGGWPRQRTFDEESVGFVSWSPERPELVFSMDEGGNERAQLFRLDVESGALHPLTDTPEAKHRWGGWSHDGDRIEAPLYVIHGANDPRVPVGEAERIVEAARGNDVPVELRIYEDEGHGLSKRENRIDAYTDVVDFLDEHV